MDKENIELVVQSARSLGYGQAISDVLSALAHESATWDHLWTPEGGRREKLDPHTLVKILQLVDVLRLENDARGDAAREV